MDQAKASQQRDWFSADRPILTRGEDKLGRRSFAESLAASVTGWRGRDSLVIALYGAWGTGKSSIKNMILDALSQKSGPEVPTIAEFNPWQFANHEQLTESFFDQIGVALGHGASGSKKEQKRLLQRWRRYVHYLKATAGFVEHIRNPLIAVLILAAVLVGIAATQAWQVAVLISVTLVVLAAFLRWSSKFAALVGGLLESGVEVGRKSLEEVKFELSDVSAAERLHHAGRFEGTPVGF